MSLIRVEVIGNMVLLEEFLELLEKHLPEQYYTVSPVLLAKGKKGRAQGDDVWMDKNFVCLIFIQEEKSIEIISNICKTIKQHSPKNALTVFQTNEGVCKKV